MLSFSKSGSKQYYHTDHLGSIRKLTDNSGAVTESTSYLAFGSRTTQDARPTTRYGFTGREDESDFGLMYYRARYYDPDAGRFISPDPFTRGPDDPRISYSNNWYSKIHGEATLYAEWLNPHNFNRYLYCNNNPVCYKDPTGQFAWALALVALAEYAAVTMAAGDWQTDAYFLQQDWESGSKGDVALDLAFMAVPVLNVGMIKAADKLADTVKAVDKAADAGKSVEKGLKPTIHSVEQKINRGIKSVDELNAAKKPLKVKDVKYDNLGRPSQQMIGEKATIAVNPGNGNITSVWETSSKKAKKLKKE